MKFKPSFPPNCPYPNLWYEHRFGVGGHPDNYAGYALVTETIFENMLNGVGDLTSEEKRHFFRDYSFWLNLKHIPITYTYLFTPHISFYDLKNKKHLHKWQCLYSQLNQAIANADKPIDCWESVSCYYNDLEEIIRQRFASRGYYNYILSLTSWVKTFGYQRKPPKRSTIYVSETHNE